MAGPFLDRKKFLCREWAFVKLAHCLEQRPASKTCGAIIVGGPGSGKTSLCCEMVWPATGQQQRLLRKRMLGYHFCQAHNVSSMSVPDFIHSLVSQLLSQSMKNSSSPPSGDLKSTSPCFFVCQQFLNKIRNDEELQAALKPDSLQRDPDEAFKKGVLFPLLELEPPKQCLFLLVDSIDEQPIHSSSNGPSNLYADGKPCSGEGSKTVAELLSSHHHLFPQWLLLVCTARRQSKHISRMFTGFRKLSLDDLRKSQVVRDVQQYILARIDAEDNLRQHISRETAEMLNQLHIKSNGCFLYLERVLDGVADNFIVLREIREIPGTLNGLYLWLSQRLFHRKHFTKVQPILSIILASRKPLTISEVFDAFWTSNTNFTRQDFSKRLHLLRRVLRLNSDGTLLLFHHSFAEWLVDVKHCTRKYLCHIDQGHAMLAMAHSLQAKHLPPDDIQNFALHLTRMTLPEDSVMEVIQKTVGFDYNTILVLWLIQSGANVENCLLAEDKKNDIIELVESRPARSEPRKRASSLGKKEPRKQKYENCDMRKKTRGRRQVSAPKKAPNYEKLKESYEELEFEPYGRRDLEKRISEDYDHLEFDVQKPDCKIITETNELLEQLTHLSIKKDETGFFETEKSPDFLRDVNEQNFKFSTIDSATKGNETSFLKLDSEDSGFLKSEDASTLGLRSDVSSGDMVAKSELTREEELDMLLNGLERSLNDETQLLDNSFLSQITQLSVTKSEGEEEVVVVVTKEDGDKTEGKQKQEVQQDQQQLLQETDLQGLAAWLEMLQVPRDPKVLRILTEAGAKVSNCNSLQRDGRTSSLGGGGVEGVISSQISRVASPNTELQELLSSMHKEADITAVDGAGRTILHTLTGEGNNTLLQLVLTSYSELDVEATDRHGQTALNLAARHGYLDIVQALLTHGANVNHADCEGWTALRAAAWGGHTAVVELLLDKGAQVDVADADQRTALRAAAWGGHEDIVKLLVAHDANVNQTDDEGRTALIAASYMGHSEIVDHLLDNRANIDHQDADGRTALSVAALCVPDNDGYVRVVNILLERGACVDHEDKDGMTPLLVAAFEGHRDVCEVLLEYEADVDHADKSGRTPLWAAASMGHSAVVELLLFWGCYVDSIDSEGRTVLCVAAAQGNTLVVRQLLDRGLDEQHRDNSGWTPLHYAAFEGHIDVCEALLESGAKVDQPDNDGKGPLMLAAQEGHGALVTAMLETHGAPTDERSHDGKSALRLAALEGHYDVVRTLLTHGADVNAKDADGRSTLYILALENRLPMARYLIEHGHADVESRDSEGRTPLQVSAWQGHCEMVSLLLSSGHADVNSTDNDNRTALHSASWQGHASIVRLLLDRGAVPDHACNQGATALGIAAQEGHEACVKALLSHGADPTHSDRCGRNAFRVAAKSGHDGVVKLLQDHSQQEKQGGAEERPVPTAPLLYGSTVAPQYSPIDSPESTTHRQRQSTVSLSNQSNISNHSKSSSNLTNSTTHSAHDVPSSRHHVQGGLSFTQRLEQCTRNHKSRPLSKMLSPLESEAQSPIYATPPHSPLSEVNSPLEEVVAPPTHHLQDEHFSRDSHMRIILGNQRVDQNHSSSSCKVKRNGIVTNPALRLMSNVKNGLECAAEKMQIHRARHDAKAATECYWKKETPL